MFRTTLFFIKLWSHMNQYWHWLACQITSVPKMKCVNKQINEIHEMKVKVSLQSSFFSQPPAPYSPAPALLPALPCPPAPGKICPAWSSPWSPWSPVNATSLVNGAWWNSFLLLSKTSAWLELILTDSLTCLFKQLRKLFRAVMQNSTFSPPCSSVQCFHRGFSSTSFLRPSWCSSPRE